MRPPTGGPFGVAGPVRSHPAVHQTATQSATVPCAQLPFAGLLPRAPDVVAASLDFAGQVLAAQRRFADGVLAARG